MTKEELEQLKPLKNEIRLLQEELNNLPTVTDSVTGSSPDFPYTSHKVVIRGIDTKRQKTLTKRLENRLDRLQDELEKLEEYIDTIDDSEMRQIIRLRYRNGLSWQQIAFEIGKYDESYPRQKVNKFLNDTEKTEKSVVI